MHGKLCCAVLPPGLATARQPALQYTLHEVSYDELYGKPQYFRDLHPQGLIPVIAFQQAAAVPAPTAAAAPEGVVCIKESLVCNEYLEDAYPQPTVSCLVCAAVWHAQEHHTRSFVRHCCQSACVSVCSQPARPHQAPNPAAIFLVPSCHAVVSVPLPAAAPS